MIKILGVSYSTFHLCWRYSYVKAIKCQWFLFAHHWFTRSCSVTVYSALISYISKLYRLDKYGMTMQWLFGKPNLSLSHQKKNKLECLWQSNFRPSWYSNRHTGVKMEFLHCLVFLFNCFKYSQLNIWVGQVKSHTTHTVQGQWNEQRSSITSRSHNPSDGQFCPNFLTNKLYFRISIST